MTRPLAFIVEDDPQLNKIFCITLQSEFEIEACSNGLEAIARLEDINPDVIVLDLNLPGASGQDILLKIRADQRLAKTRVILATADHVHASFLDDQAEVVLLKPISPIQLRELALRLSKMG